MSGDRYRVTSENVVYVVGEHERRILNLENHTEDLGVMRRDIASLSGDMRNLRNEVESLRKTIVTSAVTIAGSSLFAAATIFLVLK